MDQITWCITIHTNQPCLYYTDEGRCVTSASWSGPCFLPSTHSWSSYPKETYPNVNPAQYPDGTEIVNTCAASAPTTTTPAPDWCALGGPLAPNTVSCSDCSTVTCSGDGMGSGNITITGNPTTLISCSITVASNIANNQLQFKFNNVNAGDNETNKYDLVVKDGLYGTWLNTIAPSDNLNFKVLDTKLFTWNTITPNQLYNMTWTITSDFLHLDLQQFQYQSTSANDAYFIEAEWKSTLCVPPPPSPPPETTTTPSPETTPTPTPTPVLDVIDPHCRDGIACDADTSTSTCRLKDESLAWKPENLNFCLCPYGYYLQDNKCKICVLQQR